MKRRKAIIVFIVATIITATAAATVLAALPPAPVKLDSIWARPAIKNGNSAIYFTVTNTGKDDAILIGAASDAAAVVEVHETIHDTEHETHEHVMHMEEVPEIVIPAGATVVFAPGGKHVMLIGLENGLRVGDEVTFTLLFKHHVPLTVRAPVTIAVD